MSITVAIPTFNNPAQLRETLATLVVNTDFAGRVLVINNGEPGLYPEIQADIPYDIDWLDAGRNLGWEGGINEALRLTQTEFFCMLNDDVMFPPASHEFWGRTMRWFDMPDVGGVGPSSNYVSGMQSAHVYPTQTMLTVPYLIGFCATYRTALLKELGGLDETLPGGDDLDLSLRVRDRGLQLVADRRSYLHHHGGQTGTRVRSDWDSQKHQADTYNALIAKHGLRKWWGLVTDKPETIRFMDRRANATKDLRCAQDELHKRFLRLSLEPSDMDEHMMTLYRLASMCESVVETGTNDCTSTTALLYAQPKTLDCFDIERFPDVDEIERLAGQTKFTFHLGDVLEAELPECDFWFCDDFHEGEHVRKELDRFAHKVRKYIAFHDTALFSERGEHGGKGIWRAISEYLREHPEWKLILLNEKNNGLAVIARA